jgi:hypothetical protein
MNRLVVTGIVVAAISIGAGTGLCSQRESHGVDLGVGRGVNSHRPNILVAWRNTERILEVEILVRNLGNRPGRGKVLLEICDSEGKQLLAAKETDVTVPARANGGEQGTIVQTKGFRLMNIMFDQLDRQDQRYKLRATVHTEGEDANPLDNVATKSFNVDCRARPGTTNFYRYQITNATDAEMKGTVVFDHTDLPAGWIMSAEPEPGTKVVLAPREVLTGIVTVKTPKAMKDGDYVDLQASLATTKGGKPVVADQDEWLLVATTQPPEVDQPTWTVKPDGSVLVNVAAFDPICGIKEASGVQVAYSLDNGVTFSTRIMAYIRGDFYNKTWFEGTLGPFAPGSQVAAAVTVSNNAGITRRFELPPLTVASN